MAYYWLKFKIWAKITLVSLAVVYTALFIYNNISQEVPLWLWFKSSYITSPPILILVSFLLGVLVTLLSRILFATVRQMRQLREMRQQRQAPPPAAPKPADASSPGQELKS